MFRSFLTIQHYYAVFKFIFYIYKTTKIIIVNRPISFFFFKFLELNHIWNLNNGQLIKLVTGNNEFN